MDRIKVVWKIDAITIGALLSAVVGGTIYINTISNRLDGTVATVSSIDATVAKLSDLPYRMAGQEKDAAAQVERDKAQDARIDRQSDLILTGQETMRKVVQDGFDAMRKDNGILSTKVEVIGSKVDMLTGKPQTEAYLRPKS